MLASYGVGRPLDDQPSTLIIDAIDPLTVGGPQEEYLYLRIYNEEPSFAPPGHTVVQTMVETDYDWWATRGSNYQYGKGRRCRSRGDVHRRVTCRARKTPSR